MVLRVRILTHPVYWHIQGCSMQLYMPQPLQCRLRIVAHKYVTISPHVLYTVWTLIFAVLNFRGLRIFAFFAFLFSRMRVPQYYIEYIDYISVLIYASHISHITKHVWAARRVGVAIAKQWRRSALLCSAYWSLVVWSFVFVLFHFLCKVCIVETRRG